MPKKYTIFSIETNDSIINMEVNKSLYKAYQILSPLEKKAMQDLMTLQLLKTKNWVKKSLNIYLEKKHLKNYFLYYIII